MLAGEWRLYVASGRGGQRGRGGNREQLLRVGTDAAPGRSGRGPFLNPRAAILQSGRGRCASATHRTKFDAPLRTQRPSAPFQGAHERLVPTVLAGHSPI